ncbi:hypothetical protein V4U86_06245 [Mycobacterium sp. AMU20-3851]|uniref:hypothetical protein n=1 Tax=Mycobacterium sp. AMU20-3851 TaxID=3122055 RepID=UPI0037547DEB
MTVYEALTVALIVVLALATTLAIYVGLFNWFGAVHVVRCAACHHLTVSSARAAQTSCPQCRHQALLHPIYNARHPDHPVRVVGDRLRY